MRIDDAYTIKEELVNHFMGDDYTPKESNQMIVAVEIFVAQIKKDDFDFEYIKELRVKHLRDVITTGVRFKAVNMFCDDVEAFSNSYDEQRALFEESNA